MLQWFGSLLGSSHCNRELFLDVGLSYALVQVFEGTRGINTTQTRVRFIGKSLNLGVSRDILGRVFDIWERKGYPGCP